MNIRSHGANISIQPVNEGEEDAGVLISAYVLLGNSYATKVGSDIRLPPLAALELAEAINIAARQAMQVEEPA